MLEPTARCPLCDHVARVPVASAALHLDHRRRPGHDRVGYRCPACDVLAVVPVEDHDAVRLVVDGVEVTSGDHAPWDRPGDHDAVCVATPTAPPVPADVPPLTAGEVERMVAALDDDALVRDDLLR